MILYTLKNSSYTMEVYEERVVLYPRLWRGIISGEGAAPISLSYAQLQHVELTKRLWPAQHQLSFHTSRGVTVFHFRKLFPFFERLKLYFEKQIIRQAASAQRSRLKTVPELLRDKRQELPPLRGAA